MKTQDKRIKENINLELDEIAENKFDVKSVAYSDFVNKKRANPKTTIKSELKDIEMDPLKVYEYNPYKYNIMTYKYENHCYLFTYYDSHGFEKVGELRDFSDIDWIYAISEFFSPKNRLQSTRNMLVKLWINVYENHHKGTDLNKLLGNADKSKNDVANIMKQFNKKNAEMKRYKIFNDAFKELIKNTSDDF